VDWTSSITRGQISLPAITTPGVTGSHIVFMAWSPEKGVIAAVSNLSSTASYSLDGGMNWNTSTISVNNTWSAICWSSERSIFVAVGQSGVGNRVATSSDGVSWSVGTSAADNQWTSVCWSKEKNLFVAVAKSGVANRVMTSPNGITWTIRSTPQPAGADMDLTCIAWAPELGIFGALASGPAGIGAQRIITSTDGISWTLRSQGGTAGFWTSIAWSSRLTRFVGTATVQTAGSVMLMYSVDGASWNNGSTTQILGKIVWADPLGIFVIGGVNNTLSVLTRPLTADGVSFGSGIGATFATIPTTTTWYDLLWISELNQLIMTGVNAGTPVAYLSGRST
jgi:hypothetical protein